MMTPKRFRVLADSYGADLQRWPESLRAQARALLETSAQARAAIARARELDEVITAAYATREARLWRGESADATLQRLREHVTARIDPIPSVGATPARIAAAAPAQRIGFFRFSYRAHSPRIRWLSLATAAGIAVVVGFVLGVLYSPATPSQDLTALMQPAPLQLLTD